MLLKINIWYGMIKLFSDGLAFFFIIFLLKFNKKTQVNICQVNIYHAIEKVSFFAKGKKQT